MAEFIDFEASLAENDDDVVMVSDDSEDEAAVEAGGDEVTNFIDESSEQLKNNDPSFYRTVDSSLENVGDVDESLRHEYEESIIESQNLDIENLVHSDEDLNQKLHLKIQIKG